MCLAEVAQSSIPRLPSKSAEQLPMIAGHGNSGVELEPYKDTLRNESNYASCRTLCATNGKSELEWYTV